MSAGKLLIYLLRRDLRVSDNPILHHLATSKDHGFTHLLPVYVFPCRQVEVSGFLDDGEKSPYPPAVSQVGKFWRCGPHRAKFTAQCVWDLKDGLEQAGSGLVLRVGEVGDVVKQLIGHYAAESIQVEAVWMTEEMSSEEVEEQEAVATACSDEDVPFKVWPDEKYFIDDRDTGLDKPESLPDVFTTYRKSQEPLREKPRPSLPKPDKSALPPLPDSSSIPAQAHPFTMAETLEDLEARLVKPIDSILANPPQFPEDAKSAHPVGGGESKALERLLHLTKSGAMTSYQATRNGLLGTEFSTKLSSYLAMGCLSARQIHEEMAKLEDGTDKAYEETQGYGEGENEGTKGVRFELLWRDYMRLCTHKFGRKLFRLPGFRQDENYVKQWNTADKDKARPGQNPPPEEVDKILQRFLEGTTGMGFIDASQRELFLTGYTSNRARQNVASFFAKHLGIDWRYGAEWYEMWLVDYDVSSNWSNWQYVAGVGNDPRGDARIFNPVKQAFDYDKEGTYVRTWVPELRDFEKVENVFQPWTASPEDLEKHGLTDNIMVTDPVKRIEFVVDRKPRGARRSFPRRRGPGRGGGRGGNQGNDQGGAASPTEASSDGMGGQHGGNHHGGVHHGGHHGGHRGQGYVVGTPQSYQQMEVPPMAGFVAPPGAYGPGYAPAGWYPDPNLQGGGHNPYYRGGGVGDGSGRGYNTRGGFRGRYPPSGYGHPPPPPQPIYPQPYPQVYPPPYPPGNMDPRM